MTESGFHDCNRSILMPMPIFPKQPSTLTVNLKRELDLQLWVIQSLTYLSSAVLSFISKLANLIGRHGKHNITYEPARFGPSSSTASWCRRKSGSPYADRRRCGAGSEHAACPYGLSYAVPSIEYPVKDTRITSFPPVIFRLSIGRRKRCVFVMSLQVLRRPTLTSPKRNIGGGLLVLHMETPAYE